MLVLIENVKTITHVKNYFLVLLEEKEKYSFTRSCIKASDPN